MDHAQYVWNQVVPWLVSDRPVAEYARDVIDGRAEYGDDRPWVAVRMLVHDLLYADSGGFYRTLCRRIPGGYPFDRSALKEVRDAVGPDDLDLLDWERVVEELEEK